jgi:hypothetical protein
MLRHDSYPTSYRADARMAFRNEILSQSTVRSLGDSYELTGEHGVEAHEKSSAGTSKTSLTVKAKCFWNFGHI